MDMSKKITFVKFCLALASKLENYLGLPLEKLICLYKECIEMAKHCNDISTMVDCCVGLALLNYYMGKHADSLRCLKEILPSVVGIPSAELRVNKYLLFIYQELKEYDKVVLHAKKWIKIAQNTNDNGVEVFKAYLTLGRANKYLEKYDKAIQNFKQCIEIAQENGDKKFEMEGYYHLADVYMDTTQVNDASLCIDAGMAIAKELGDEKSEKDFQNLRSGLRGTVGSFDNDRDEPLFGGVLNQELACSDLSVLVQRLNELENTKDNDVARSLFSHLLLKDHQEKVFHHLKQLTAMKLFRFIGNARVYEEKGEKYKALTCYKEGLPIAASCSDNMFRSIFYHGFGNLLHSLNKDLHLAEHYAREAIRCFEEVFATLGSRDEFKISMFDLYIYSYKLLAKLLIKREQKEEALLVLDRCRARALKDLMMAKYKMK